MFKKLLLVAALFLGVCAATAHAQENVTIDMAVNNGAAQQRASGFLHGMNSTSPIDALVTPLKGKLWRGTSMYTTDPNTYARVLGLGGTPMFILSDLWNAINGCYNNSGACPGDGGNWAAWDTFVNNQVSADLAAGRIFQYDVWNEPDSSGIFWPRPYAQFEEAWRRARNDIKAQSGSLKIVGPSTTHWSSDTTDFMAYAKTNSVLPDIVAFHELNTVAVAASEIAAAQSYLATNEPALVNSIDVTEIVDFSNTYVPGSTVQYLAVMERSQIQAAAHACWTDSDCNFTLSGTLESDASTKRAVWYAYQAYANITGSIVGITPGATIDGVAGSNVSAQQAYSVFGRAGASSDAVFNFIHISSASYLNVSGLVHAKVYTLANDGGSGSSGPTLLSESNLTVSGDAVSVTVPSMGTNDVAIIQLTPGPGGGGGSCSSLPAHGILDCTRFTDWSRSKVGVLGGIPSASWTQCGATIAPYGTQGSPNTGAPATINTAIANCGANQFVALGAGNFWLNGMVDYNGKSNVVLRGSTTSGTWLHFTGGGICYTGEQMVCFYGSGINPTTASVQPGGTRAFSWTGGFAQGATSLTIASVGSVGLSNGDIVILDQANNTTDNGGPLACDQNMGYVCLTEAPSFAGRTVGGLDRSQNQIVTIVSGCPCSGAGPFTVTIAPGLFANNWNTTSGIGGWWASPAHNIGIENLTLDNSQETCSGSCDIMAVNDVDSWWVKNVRFIQGGRSHIITQMASHGEIRDSYFQGTKNGATQSYGLELSLATSTLVENNIFQGIASPLIGPGASSGNVYGFNFSINNVFTLGGGGLMQVSYFNHDAGNNYNLYEENQFNSLACDDTHGNSSQDTAFRNRLNGRDYNTAGGPGAQPSGFTQVMSWDSYCRGYNVIGNVLGTPGYHTNYQAVATDNSGNDTATQAVCNATVYDIGSGAGVCRGGAQFGEAILNDPITVSSMMRWGNYDTATQTIRWDAAESAPVAIPNIGANVTPSTHVLPVSMYLAAQPSWYTVVSGTQPPYPAIGPDVTGGSGPAGHSYNIPAANCYFNIMAGPFDGGGGALSYDATLCYSASGGGGSAAFSAAPSSANFGSVLIGSSSNTQNFVITNTGTANYVITGAIVNSGGNVNDFVYISSGCVPQSGDTAGTIPAGHSCTLSMAFAPQAGATGARSTTVTIPDNIGGHTIALSGTASGSGSNFTWSTVQAPASTNCSSASSCAATVASTGAGHLLVVVAINEAVGPAVTSFTAGGCNSTWTKATGTSNGSLSSVEIWYCLNSASGATSIGPVNWSASGLLHTIVREFSVSGGTISLDTGPTPTCSAQLTTAVTNPAACSLTPSANNDVYVQGIAPTFNVSALSGAYTSTFPGGNGEGFAINQNTYVAPTWTSSGNGTYNEVSAAFTSVSANTGNTPPSLTPFVIF